MPFPIARAGCIKLWVGPRAVPARSVLERVRGLIADSHSWPLRAGTARGPARLAERGHLPLYDCMNGEPNLRPPGPPHNPGLRELIAGKRHWSATLKREDSVAGFRGWHERGYLPHRDEPGLTQFVTFHIVDSFPAVLRAEWGALLEVEDDRERRKKLEAYLDRGRGECWLRQPAIGNLVEGALRFHHGTQYDLRAWVVMANHVHVLFKVGPKPMGQVIADWKEFTAREANKLLGRRGQFWAGDFWDTYMRNPDHELRARRYTENNPLKAKLVREAKEWPWSSARFRDEYGRLRL